MLKLDEPQACGSFSMALNTHSHRRLTLRNPQASWNSCRPNARWCSWAGTSTTCPRCLSGAEQTTGMSFFLFFSGELFCWWILEANMTYVSRSKWHPFCRCTRIKRSELVCTTVSDWGIRTCRVMSFESYHQITRLLWFREFCWGYKHSGQKTGIEFGSPIFLSNSSRP